MAPYLIFPGYDNPMLKSARPFDREWEKMEEAGHLQNYKLGKALKATNSELIVPISFLVFFTLTAISSIAVEWVYYGDLVKRIVLRLL
jgi:hypothetical protein